MNTFPMLLSSHTPLILAQEAAPPIAGPGGELATTPSQGAPGGPGAGPGGAARPTSPFGGGFMLILLVLVGVMILPQIFAGRKEKKRRAAMLRSMSRHDRVQTVGGLIGTISDIKDNEIVIKIDESTNTKIHVVRSAVQQVLKKAGETSEPELALRPEKVAS